MAITQNLDELNELKVEINSVDENGVTHKEVKTVILPTFNSTEEDSFNILEDEEIGE